MTTSRDKYCASCATPLEQQEVFGTERPVCPECGRVVFYDPKVAAVCVIARDGKVLMIRRATDLGYGLWSFPGGFVDRGEVVEAAAAREAWEETGLEVAVDRLLGLFSLPGDPVIVVAFTAHETGGELAPGPEALETAFFSPDALPELAFSRDTEILSRSTFQRADGQGVTPLLSRVARSVIDLVFPIYCVGCGHEGGIICEPCASGLKHLSPPYCRICAAPGVDGVCRWCLEQRPGFESLRSPYRFEGPVREAIHALKYQGLRVASEALGELMAQHLKRNSIRADALVPVPLHRRRLRSRGYNQSALLARHIGRSVDLPVRGDMLVRVRNVRPQVETQTREERRSNVTRSFACKVDVSGLTILLIDDVATTGSTLSECASVLTEAGACRVYALTLARDA